MAMANEESPLRGRTGFLNCFMNQKDEPTNQVKEEASLYFSSFGPHNIVWKQTINEEWYGSVEFKEDLDCGSCEAKSCQNKPCFVGIKPTIKRSLKRPHRPGEVSSPFGNLLKEINSPNSASLMALSSPHCQNLNDEDSILKILRSMRTYGQCKKQKNWQEFAVILVLPESEYSKIKPTGLLSESLLTKYARTAVPSSYVSSLDHCEDESKSVIHAERKLVGDPKRHPSRFAVPYDRSCLVQLVTEHRKSEWLKGKSVDEITKSFKVFLYSEKVVCKFCVNAIFDSVFYNLVEKGFCSTDEFLPVIGYNFSNGDITSWIQERLRFYGPRSTMPVNTKCCDGPIAAKRNLKEDLEHVPTQACTLMKDGEAFYSPVSGEEK